mmetsp:Transcript_4270/g.10399  ORF Transcript_4270/g.10399 Transcript_4270/m.10399 type:complete len:682 (-) Transcript_4270:209-2254(-)
MRTLPTTQALAARLVLFERVSAGPVVDAEELAHGEVAGVPDVLVGELLVSQRFLLTQPTAEIIPHLRLRALSRGLRFFEELPAVVWREDGQGDWGFFSLHDRLLLVHQRGLGLVHVLGGPARILHRVRSRGLQDGVLQLGKLGLGRLGGHVLLRHRNLELPLRLLPLHPGLRQEVVVDLFSSPLVVVHHLQQFLPRHRSAPPPLHLHDQILPPPVVPARFDSACPTLQLHDGPHDSWSCTAQVLLYHRIQALEEQQYVRRVQEKMQLPVTLAVQECEAVRAQQLLFLLVEDRGAHVCTLIAHGGHGNLGNRVLSPVPVEVALPEALQAEVVPTEITMKCRRVVLALVARDVLLDDFAVAHGYEHRAVVASEPLLVHGLEAGEAEVILAVAAEHLWFLHVAGGAKAPDRRVANAVILFRAHGELVQVVVAALAIALQALVALDRGLEDTTVLAGDLEVAELLVEEDVRLAEKESAHGRFRPEGQNVDSAPLEDLQIPLRQRVLQRVVVVLQIVEVNDVALTDDHFGIWRHGCVAHFARYPRELGLKFQLDPQILHEVHYCECVFPGRIGFHLQHPGAAGFVEEFLGGEVQVGAGTRTLVHVELVLALILAVEVVVVHFRGLRPQRLQRVRHRATSIDCAWNSNTRRVKMKTSDVWYAAGTASSSSSCNTRSALESKFAMTAR